VTFGNVAHGGGQEIDVPLDLLRDLAAGEHSRPCRGKFDRQRNALQQLTNLHQGRSIRFGQFKFGVDLVGALEE
jgi:hypothetical protein